MNKSLLGSLAERFVTQKENLTSEALNIIINRSIKANESFCRSVSKHEDRLEKKLKFTTQVHSSDDKAIPDLIGYDSNSSPVCIIEAKFWASLTKNQPETYISRLDPGTPSVLVFLAPQARKYSLYMELISRNKAVRLGDYKLVQDWEKGTTDNWELYNLSKDRTEIKNIISELPDKADQMVTMYNNWAKNTGVIPWEDLEKIRNKKD